MFVQLLMHRRIDDFASLQIDEAIANFLEFFASRVVSESFDHATAARGNHRRIKRVVAVAVAAHLGQAPARTQEAGQLAADHHAAAIAIAIGAFALWMLIGVGGGIMRDILATEMPYIFVRHIYAIASIIGALLTGILWPVAGQNHAILTGFIVTILIRALAAHYKWNLPHIRKH